MSNHFIHSFIDTDGVPAVVMLSGNELILSSYGTPYSRVMDVIDLDAINDRDFRIPEHVKRVLKTIISLDENLDGTMHATNDETALCDLMYAHLTRWIKWRKIDVDQLNRKLGIQRW